MEVGGRYVTVDHQAWVHVLYLTPTGELVVEVYLGPSEVPEDRRPLRFQDEGHFWVWARVRFPDLAYVDQEAPLEHVVALLLCPLRIDHQDVAGRSLLSPG